MSKKPTKWISEIDEKQAEITKEIKENLNVIRKLILSHGKKFSLTVPKTPPEKILKILKKSVVENIVY